MNKELDIAMCIIDDSGFQVERLSNVCVRGLKNGKRIFDIFTKSNKKKIFESYTFALYKPYVKISKGLSLSEIEILINKN